jgi:hypothetical protein
MMRWISLSRRSAGAQSPAAFWSTVRVSSLAISRFRGTAPPSESSRSRRSARCASRPLASRGPTDRCVGPWVLQPAGTARGGSNRDIRGDATRSDLRGSLSLASIRLASVDVSSVQALSRVDCIPDVRLQREGARLCVGATGSGETPTLAGQSQYGTGRAVDASRPVAPSPRFAEMVATVNASLK